FRLHLEYVDEQLTDRLTFFFRVLDAGERLEEQLLGDNMHERNIVSAAEQGDHAFAFAEPQQAVVDEHAGELVADRFVDQHGGDGGIDAAGKTANHPALADLPADFLDRLVLERAHRPIAGTASDIAHEIADERRTVRRVHDFEVELRGVEFALLIGDHRDRGVSRRPGRGKTGRRLGDAVAMAHPHRVALADLPNAVIQRRRLCHLDLGAAELAVMAALDLAAELLRHGLLAVTDAEHGYAG